MNKEALRQKASELQEKRIDMQIAQRAVSLDKDAKTAKFVMSTVGMDRHEEIVDQESWILRHFLTNPAFFWGHMSNSYPLGKWLDVQLEEDPDKPGEMRLVGTAEFATEVDPEIERAWQHVVRGDLNMVSVGFIPHRVEYDDEKGAIILYECELIECSLVGIGSNRDALIKQSMIETKQTIQESIENSEDASATRKRNAITLLNKAIRAYK